MNAELRPEEKECEVINFPKVEEEKITKIPKLTKAGEIKKTPCNSKENRDKICPIKEEDILCFVNYFYNKYKNSTNDEDKTIYRRNLAGFVMGLNIGLRASDLVRLKWSDIYFSDWTIRETKSLKPKKTSRTNKHIEVQYSTPFRLAIEQYRDYYKPENKNEYDSYIFKSREKDKDGNEKCIEPNTWAGIIKKAAENIGIKYNVASHSLRKGFARIRYNHAIDKGDALVELMDVFKHSSLEVTKVYLGITQEERKEFYNLGDVGYNELLSINVN